MQGWQQLAMHFENNTRKKLMPKTIADKQRIAEFKVHFKTWRFIALIIKTTIHKCIGVLRTTLFY